MPIVWKSPGAPPPASGPVLIPSIALIVVGCLGVLGSWNVRFFGKDLGAPLGAWLATTIDPEAVRSARQLVATLFVGLAFSGVVLLLRQRNPLRNTLWSAPEVRSFLADWKLLFTTWMVFVCFLSLTIVALVGLAFDVPGSWLDENLGPPRIGPVEMVICGAVTLLLGLYLIHLTRKVHSHPLYGRKPRQP